MIESRHLEALEKLDQADFEAHVGKRFELETGTLRLARVDAGAQPGAFTLLFETEEGGELPQGMHRLGHEALGEFGLFLVPVGPAAESGAPCYEAVFSRVSPDAP